MTLSFIDWLIVAAVLLITLSIGIISARRSGANTSEFFLSGRSMPWWLLGTSMVATTFSTDTPNLVTDLVRQGGIAGNWVWWAFLLTGMLTVFVYARLWRKSNVLTDMEFYELRYSGGAARFLRLFRSLYLGVVFNVLAMAGVILAAIKIGEVMLGWSSWQTIGLTSAITLIFAILGGLRGVVLSDFFLFAIAMVGSIGAAIVAVQQPEIGDLSSLFNHEFVHDKMHLVPSTEDPSVFFGLLIVPLAVQWWSSWYPGAEPGGGGYIAQRMLAARDEKHAVGATLLFNIAHYALRPWPWIIVALASLIIFPDLESIQRAFPTVSESKLGHDLGYPAMLTLLPQGLLGLVLASLTAAFMSTISTHLNWGSSYVVHDFYKRFINPAANERNLVLVGRLSTAAIMILAVLFAQTLQNAKELFDIIIMFGAGTGLIFILRWFWWRINAWTEIVAMFSSGLIALLIKYTGVFDFVPEVYQLPFSVLITTIIWLIVCYTTPPTDGQVLYDFYRKIRPGGPGWKRIVDTYGDAQLAQASQTTDWKVPHGILAMSFGCVMVYALLFATGFFLRAEWGHGLLLFGIALIAADYLRRNWRALT